MNNFFPRIDDYTCDITVRRDWSRDEFDPEINSFSNSLPATSKLVSPKYDDCCTDDLHAREKTTLYTNV